MPRTPTPRTPTREDVVESIRSYITPWEEFLTELKRMASANADERTEEFVFDDFDLITLDGAYPCELRVVAETEWDEEMEKRVLVKPLFFVVKCEGLGMEWTIPAGEVLP